MPRGPRLDAPGVLHHVMVRGIEGRLLFREDADRQDFVARLAAVAPATGLVVLAWALLPNHAHLLVRTGTRPLAEAMARLLTGYAGAFNRRHRRGAGSSRTGTSPSWSRKNPTSLSSCATSTSIRSGLASFPTCRHWGPTLGAVTVPSSARYCAPGRPPRRSSGSSGRPLPARDARTVISSSPGFRRGGGPNCRAEASCEAPEGGQWRLPFGAAGSMGWRMSAFWAVGTSSRPSTARSLHANQACPGNVRSNCSLSCSPGARGGGV